nr:ribonuclease H-like domain, reverse transcriptase, RNA-dependent DNA polymerase [Tanacetum cinerariifolium]
CLLGKHSRALFPNQTNTKSSEPLNLVFRDLCGPISPETESRKKYMFLLVDDCTRVPTKALKDSTPYEALKDRKPNMRHLRVFGCKAYAKIEIDSINKNKTWKLATLPDNQKAIGLKWVFKTKRDGNGKIIKHKARLVAKGYVQAHGIDYDEVFALVATMETVRLIHALLAYHG